MISSSLLVLALSFFTSANAATAAIKPLPVNGKFDYQIGGAYTPVSDVAVVSRDRTASPAAGKYNLCYVNAFQTQPGEESFWKSSTNDHLLLRNKSGDYFIDPEWPDEFILDTSTDAKRQEIATIVNGWITDCKNKGFDAIEADNLDTFSRSDKLLTIDNNLALAKLLTNQAHSLGLAFGQKNSEAIGSRGKSEAGFDFAVVEQCQEFDECDAYSSVYGNSMVEIEYKESAFNTACSNQGKQISVIFRDVEVSPSGSKNYKYKEC